MSDLTNASMPVIATEHFSAENATALQELIASGQVPRPMVELISAVTTGIPEQFRSTTRVIFTADFVRSVNDRRTDPSEEDYARERGAGIVAGKMMGRQTDGLVDILFPDDWITIPSTEASLAMLRHLGAHEAVHATVHHLGDEPFKVYQRDHFGPATADFASMAAEQVEEHLAEYVANQTHRGPDELATTAAEVKGAFEAWQRDLAVLTSIPRSDPDYFRKGMTISFTALHNLWKVLVYLAAALRHKSQFDPVNDEIRALPDWEQCVAPWWDEYLALLSQIPMTVEQDIPASDAVVRNLSSLLQEWALGVGFDYHDTEHGGFFRLTRFDQPNRASGSAPQPPSNSQA